MNEAIICTHECDGRICDKAALVKRTVKLGCGCTRHECERHDDTAGVHFLTGGCEIHEVDEVRFVEVVA